MNFLEKNLEDIIFNTPNELLQERGLSINGQKKRQIKIGDYGIADVISFYLDRVVNYDSSYVIYLHIEIYELKQNKIDYNALKQVVRYRKGIEHYFKKRGGNIQTSISIKLIGNEIDKSDFVYLIDYVDNLSCYTYSYDFNGINFKLENNYTLINPGFKIKNSKTNSPF
jgi:hypothetical protein